MPLHRRRRGHFPTPTRRSLDVAGLRAQHHVQGAAVIVHLDGDIDVSTESVWREALEKALAAGPSDGAVVVELSRLGFFGSVGLHLLADALRSCASNGRALRLVHVPPVVSWRLAAVGLDDIPQFTDIDAALHGANEHVDPDGSNMFSGGT